MLYLRSPKGGCCSISDDYLVLFGKVQRGRSPSLELFQLDMYVLGFFDITCGDKCKLLKNMICKMIVKAYKITWYELTKIGNTHVNIYNSHRGPGTQSLYKQ